MKKLLLTAVAAITLASPLIAASASAQSPRYGPTQQQQPVPQYQNDRDDRRDNRDVRRDDRDNARDFRRDERGARMGWRDDRRDARWDDTRHNGYYRNNRWYSGPPPAAYYGPGYNRRNITLGYKPWKRGQHLGYHNTRYAEVDYRTYNLRRPPRGYHWVRDDGGDYLLAAIAGGLIAQIIINSGR